MNAQDDKSRCKDCGAYSKLPVHAFCRETIGDAETPKAELNTRLAVNAAAYRMSEAIHLLTQSGVRGDWVSVNAALASIKVGVRMIEDEYDSLTCAKCGKMRDHAWHGTGFESGTHSFIKKDA
jgi:hypothetical protein